MDCVYSFFFGVWVAIMAVAMSDSTFHDGVQKVQKEAFDRGYMEKVIDKNDQVVYEWKENK